MANYIQILELSAGEMADRAGLALPEGVDKDLPVKIFGGGTLVFDQFGRARFHIAKPIYSWSRQMRRLTHLVRAGLADKEGRLGFSDGAARGQAFAALHNTVLGSGEVW